MRGGGSASRKRDRFSTYPRIYRRIDSSSFCLSERSDGIVRKSWNGPFIAQTHAARRLINMSLLSRWSSNVSCGTHETWYLSGNIGEKSFCIPRGFFSRSIIIIYSACIFVASDAWQKQAFLEKGQPRRMFVILQLRCRGIYCHQTWIYRAKVRAFSPTLRSLSSSFKLKIYYTKAISRARFAEALRP